MDVRIGIGFDAHRFDEGRPLILGGVEIEHERGLTGHSDADVLVHAVIDAVLGAMRAGDIGEHFPDDDPRFAGASSLDLLEKTARHMHDGGFRVIDIDAVLMLEEPRVAPHRDAMRVALARAMGIERSRVGVKATTTEGMGFAGRREGVAAQAVALLERLGA